MLSQTLIKYSSLFLKGVDNNGLRIFLESSPIYPTLLSVIQTLQYVGLDCNAGQCDWEYLEKIGSPFLLHLKHDKQEILIIAKWDNTSHSLKTYNLKNKRWVIKDRADVERFWNGVVIYTNDRQTRESNGWQFGIFILIIFGISLLAAISLHHDKMAAIYYIPMILGFVISCCLYMKSDMPLGGMIDRLCNISTATDCERVDKSSYSSVVGFKMNCLALAFFLSQLAASTITVLMEISGNLSSLYSISAAAILPMIGYSVYGQFKVGKICPLCILVAACVAAEAAMFIGMSRYSINIKVCVLWSGIFLITALTLRLISDYRSKNNEHAVEEMALLRLKRREEIISLESTPIKAIESPIWFGDENSPIRVTTVISPGCNHCRKVVAEFIPLLKTGLRFRWDIVLGATSKKDSQVIDRWIQEYLSDKNGFFRELSVWGGGKIPNLPSSDLNTGNTEISEIKKSFNILILGMNISGFPRIILNDRLLSSIYTSSDLEYIITDKVATLK